MFVASKADWDEISDALPQYREYGPMGGERQDDVRLERLGWHNGWVVAVELAERPGLLAALLLRPRVQRQVRKPHLLVRTDVACDRHRPRRERDDPLAGRRVGDRRPHLQE
jgi:hypothetical protein